MDLVALSRTVEIILVLSLVVIAAAVLGRLFNGRVLLGGLLTDRKGSELGFARLHLLAVTLMVAVGYVVAALARDPRLGLPDVPPVVLLALTGSHAFYIGGKFTA